jgi:predicted ATP-dependent serine protease
MIVTWQCQQCGWMNDNNMGACRRCGGDEDTKGRVKTKADPAKIAGFDAARKVRDMARNGGVHDRRREPS